MKRRFMTSEMGPKSIRDVLDKLEDEIADGIAAAMEIDVSGKPQERREQVVAALNDDAEALARLLLKIDREIFELVREVVEKGKADIGIMDLFEHPVSADLVSFLVQFFPEDTQKEGTDIHYFMPTDKGFGDNVRRLFADANFLSRRRRADGMRRFLKGVATFYGAVDRIDLDKVLNAIGRDVADEFELGASVAASECFDFEQNGVVRNDFQLCLRNPPNGLGEYLMPVSAPQNKDEERSLDGLLSSILEERRRKPIKLPTVDDLLQLTSGNEYDFIETDEGEDLLDFLIDELGYDGEWGVDFLGYVALRVRIGADVEAVLKGLSKEFGFTIPSKKKLADEFLALFCNYFNSVPTWGNYGAAPAEMHRLLGTSNDIELKAFAPPQNLGDSGDDDEEDYDDDDSDLPWEREGSAEDISAEKLVPSVYPSGPVDFRWVKDPDEKRRRLEEYDWLRPVLVSYVYKHISANVDQKERKRAEKALGISDDAEPDLNRVCTDFAANIQLLKGTNARLRAIAQKDEMKPAFRIASDYYANYSYVWLKAVAMKSGVGLKCLNLLSGEELFLMEKSLSTNPQVKGMTLCAGIAPMNSNRYVAVGHAMLANFEMPERFLADTLKNVGIEKQPPCVLTPEEQEILAVATICCIAANPMRIRIS